MHHTSGVTTRAARRALQASAARMPRAGYTLLEMLLVLAIITVLMAMAWPSALVLFADHKLGDSAEKVRELLSRSRAHAIEHGIIYQFLAETGGRRYVLAPYQTTTDDAAANAAYFRQAEGLPEGIKFSEENAAPADAPGVAPHLLAGLPDADELTRANWGLPVLFYPDGSASDAILIVTDEDERIAEIRVRELTGSVSVAAVRDGGGK